MGNDNLIGGRRYFSSKPGSKKRRGTQPNNEPIDVSEKGWYWCMVVYSILLNVLSFHLVILFYLNI